MEYYYTTPEKVRRFVGLDTAFTGSTSPSLEQVEGEIRNAQFEIERRTGRAWRKKLSAEEYPAGRFKDRDGVLVVHLDHVDVIEFSIMKNWNGSSWDNWLTGKTEGRADDYWVDYANGEVHSDLITTDVSGFHVQYYHGAPATTLNGDLTDSATTITVTSTTGFLNEGVLRIEDEEIYYSGLTATTFTGCSRGINDTTASAHSDTTELIPVYPEIDELCKKLVAYNLLYSNDRTSVYPEGNTQITPDMKKDKLKSDIDNRIYYLQQIMVRG